MTSGVPTISFIEAWRTRLTLPMIAAPMTGVSGPSLVSAACKAGVIGAFPTENTPTIDVLRDWLTQVDADLSAHSDSTGTATAPLAVNLVMRRNKDRIAKEVDVLVRHGVALVITSVGSPAPVVAPLRDAGVRVIADVATLRHAERALETGVDGLVLLAAGAGGQTGWMNPFAFVRAVRDIYDGPIVLAGGVADGAALWASIVLGCDLAYVGTGMIATDESLASEEYKQALVSSTLDDVENFIQASGLAASVLRLATQQDVPVRDPTRPPSKFSAGHSVSMVRAIEPVSRVVDRLRTEYAEARRATFATLHHSFPEEASASWCP
jgi:nitronate monooxygenase